MTEPNVELRKVAKEDVSRINQWLADDEVAENWFGRYSYGNPAHLGYHPEQADTFSDQQWTETFSNPEHAIFSVYTPDGSHIGESHIAIEESLGDGQISILIGARER